MPYSKDSVPTNHSEFGGGPGLIDPQRREDRALEGHERLMEIYATTAESPAEAHGATDVEIAERAAEIATENNPEIVRIERP